MTPEEEESFLGAYKAIRSTLGEAEPADKVESLRAFYAGARAMFVFLREDWGKTELFVGANKFPQGSVVDIEEYVRDLVRQEMRDIHMGGLKIRRAITEDDIS